MNRTSLVFSAAMAAASVLGSTAFAQDTSKSIGDAPRQAEQGTATGAKPAAAQDAGNLTNKADPTKAVPDREDLKPGGAPTVRDMDANAQRQHDPDRAAGASGSAEGANAQTRDWSKVDTDNDGSVSPEEMEAWLKQAGPQSAPEKSTPQKSTPQESTPQESTRQK